ncbi:hypothetical protein HPB48_020302 [Haemaphysalis longicornis]|uniref:C2 domain-containing protein n=1 Tax=Haemaphysalis longicornis TaxID=44386 RepID=A0A9J6GVW6_HAELO|nr:hypothetical protein HPB48_020302 [Haemaphysalis longicornis]
MQYNSVSEGAPRLSPPSLRCFYHLNQYKLAQLVDTLGRGGGAGDSAFNLNLPLCVCADTYVKVTLCCGDRKAKKRKTSVKKASAQPAWNEALSFDVTEEQLSSRAQLLVNVWRHGCSGASTATSLGAFQLVSGGASSSASLGSFQLGPATTDSGAQHWRDMLANPRRAVARWHALQPNP